LHIVPRLPAFFARFPDVRVELSVSERRVDLMREGIDIAVRIGILDDFSLVARRIGSMRTRTVAKPDYLARYGTPSAPSELQPHNLLAGQFQGVTVDWQLKGPEGPILVEPEGNFRSNDADDLPAAVLAGLGIGHGASALFDADLRAGRVIGILHGFAPDLIPIHAVCPGGRRIPQRSRVFMDFLADIFAAEPGLCIE
jgi:LysR family transcriptional regulator for bpeEF and oprC